MAPTTLALLALLALQVVACATTWPAHGRRPAVVVLDPELSVPEGCEEAVTRALRRAGVGPDVEVEVTFMDEPMMDTGSRVVSTAVLTASWRDSSSREVVAYGTASDAYGAGRPTSPAGRAHMAACVVGADRLAETLAAWTRGGRAALSPGDL
ncbi:MAG: hypothetical protein U0324_34480 [Polyangiales bacterium]